MFDLGLNALLLPGLGALQSFYSFFAGGLRVELVDDPVGVLDYPLPGGKDGFFVCVCPSGDVSGGVVGRV